MTNPSQPANISDQIHLAEPYVNDQLHCPFPLHCPFSKAHRLLIPAHFGHVFDKPERKLHSSHLMAFIRSNELDHPRLGLAITKKKVPTAVGRNRLKRLARENFRLTAHQLKHKDIIIIVKRPIQQLSKAQLNQQLQQLLTKLKVNPSSATTVTEPK